MSNEETIFGIDLGLTNAYIAYVDGAGSPVVIQNIEKEHATPAVVELGGEWITAGAIAKRKTPLPPSTIISMALRWLGDDLWTVTSHGTAHTAEQVVALILKKVINDARIHTGHDIKRAVMTCPAALTVRQRDALRSAGRLAGLDVAGLLSAPAAVGIGYTMTSPTDTPPDQVALVYDLGGASFTTAVLALRGGALTLVRMGGDTRLGGRVWDGEIATYLAEQWMAKTGMYADNPLESPEAAHDLTLRAEAARQALSLRAETEVVVDHEGHAVAVHFTREQFNGMAAPLLEETVIRARETVDAARVTPYGAIDTILLAGGAAQTPQVASKLQAAFPFELRRNDPDLAAVKGAAIYARRLALGRPIEIHEDPGFASGQGLRSSVPPVPLAPLTPRRIFISYKSGDRPAIDEMADRLEQDGHTVWYDKRLVGGQRWWDEILRNIRESDIFVFALTPAALESEPCKLEYQYASDLNRHVLPVRLAEDVDLRLLPTALQKIQLVDYQTRGATAHDSMRLALRQLSLDPPLPAVLPPEPPTPVSPLGELRSRLGAHTLEKLDQFQILYELRTLRNRPETAIAAGQLLKMLQSHPDTLATVANEIRTLLGE